jgi:ankyrin repeat protein
MSKINSDSINNQTFFDSTALKVIHACIHVDVDSLQQIAEINSDLMLPQHFNYQYRFNLPQYYQYPQDHPLLLLSTQSTTSNNTINNTLLDLAVISNSTVIIDQVLERFYYDDPVEIPQCLPQSLAIAFLLDKKSSIRHLILHKAFRSTMIQSIIDFLVDQRSTAILQFLVTEFCSFDNDVAVPLHSPIFNLLNEAVKTKNHDLIKYFIIDIGISVNIVGMNRISPLIAVTKRFEWEMVKYLIEKYQANIDIQRISECFVYPNTLVQQLQGLSLLHFALMDPDITTDLIAYFITQLGIDVNMEGYDGITALMIAVMYQPLSIIKYLIEQHQAILLARTTTNKSNLLHFAAISINPTIELFEYLISSGLDINQCPSGQIYGSYYRSAMQIAVRTLPLNFVKYLFESHQGNIQFKPNTGFYSQQSPIHECVYNPDQTCFEYILHKSDFRAHVLSNPDSFSGCDIDEAIATVQRATLTKSLQQAVESGQVEIIKILLEQYELPTYIGNANRQYDLLSLCISRAYNKQHQQAFRYLVNTNLFDLNLTSFNNPNSTYKISNPVLLSVLQIQYFPIDDIKFVLAQPTVDPQVRDIDGFTAINSILSRFNGENLNEVDELLDLFINEFKVDVNQNYPTQKGQSTSPLLDAIKKSQHNPSVMKPLISLIINKYKADVKIVDWAGCTPLMLVTCTCPHIAKILIQADPTSINQQDTTGDTALQKAIGMRNYPLVHFFLTQHPTIDFNIPNVQGFTPLYNSVRLLANDLHTVRV